MSFEDVDSEFYLILDSSLFLTPRIGNMVLQSLAGVLAMCLHHPSVVTRAVARFGCIMATKPPRVVVPFGLFTNANVSVVSGLADARTMVETELSEHEIVQNAILESCKYASDDVARFQRANATPRVQTSVGLKSVGIIFISTRVSALGSPNARRDLQSKMVQFGCGSGHRVTVLQVGSLAAHRNGQWNYPESDLAGLSTQQTELNVNEIRYLRLNDMPLETEYFFKDLFSELLRTTQGSVKIALGDTEIECECQSVASRAFLEAYEYGAESTVVQTVVGSAKPGRFGVQTSASESAAHDSASGCLRVVSQIPISQLCDAVLIGRATVVQPTHSWRLELDEILRNKFLFETLAETLLDTGMALICESTKPSGLNGKSVKLYFAVYVFELQTKKPVVASSVLSAEQQSQALMQSQTATQTTRVPTALLLRQVVPCELYLPTHDRTFLTSERSNEQKQKLGRKFEALLGKLPLLDSLNPFCFRSGLIDVAIEAHNTSVARTDAVSLPGPSHQRQKSNTRRPFL